MYRPGVSVLVLTDNASQKRNFLINIGAEICGRHHPNGQPGHVLDEVQDKVVQDADDSEGGFSLGSIDRYAPLTLLLRL